MSDYHAVATHDFPLFDYGENAVTSRAAAYKAAKPKRKIRSVVALQCLRDAGAAGLTRHELSEAMGLPLQSVCSVVLSILRDGLAIEDGRKRTSPLGSPAAVMVATECKEAS